MKRCCGNCAKQYVIERLDYYDGGCKHSYENGFACGSVLDEGIVYHMVGIKPDTESCEMWVERK